jgi:CDP-glycerol glycerophosphotransferase (TagB/SpsB family)
MFPPFIKNPIKFILKGVVYRFVVGRLLALPAAWLVPKKKNTVLFIGRDDGQFIDNVKYLYLYAYRTLHRNNDRKSRSMEEKIDISFLTENRHTYRELREKGYPVIFFPTLRSVYRLLRTSLVIVDNINWIVKFKNMLLHRARKIQLFHAVPIKQIGSFSPILKRERQYRLMRFYQWVNGQHQVYDCFLSSSPFFTHHVFSRAYPSRRIYEGGLPRNDALFFQSGENEFSGDDRKYYEQVKRLRQEGQKIILYMPTFRDSGKGVFYEKILNVETFSNFVKEQNVHFLVKYHQLEKAKYRDTVLDTVTGITFLYDVKDIYPILPQVDLLITDYSSIFFDYLLLDRPMVFFPYDLETYITEERGLIFDYEQLTPGPRCLTQEELEKQIRLILDAGEDHYKSERENIARIAFKYRDGHSSRRIWDDLCKQYFRH